MPLDPSIRQLDTARLLLDEKERRNKTQQADSIGVQCEHDSDSDSEDDLFSMFRYQVLSADSSDLVAAAATQEGKDEEAIKHQAQKERSGKWRPPHMDPKTRRDGMGEAIGTRREGMKDNYQVTRSGVAGAKVRNLPELIERTQRSGPASSPQPAWPPQPQQPHVLGHPLPPRRVDAYSDRDQFRNPTRPPLILIFYHKAFRSSFPTYHDLFFPTFDASPLTPRSHLVFDACSRLDLSLQPFSVLDIYIAQLHDSSYTENPSATLQG